MACWLLGIALLNQLQANCFARVSDRLMVALWLGVAVLPIVLLGTALFLPLTPWVGGIIVITLSGLALWAPRTRLEIANLRQIVSPQFILTLLVLAIAVAAFTSRKITWIDTGLYHAQAIRWLSTFGVVPGLTLLSEQLGFSSSWFALAAPLNAEILSGRASTVANGLILFVALTHLCVSGGQIFSHKALVSDWFITIFLAMTILPLVGTNLLSAVLVSPSPDIPVIFLSGAIAWLMLLITYQPIVEDQRVLYFALNAELIPLVLAAGAVSIKLTALPLLAIAFLFYWSPRLILKVPPAKYSVQHSSFLFTVLSLNQRIIFRVHRFWIGIAVSLLLLSPIFMAGIITSGCPLYPSSFLCLDLPWSQSIQEANRIAEATRGWGSWFGTAPSGVYAPLWLFWQWFTSIQSSKFIVLLIGLSVLSMLYVAWMSKLHQHSGYIWLLLLAILGTAFTMLKAPLLRFGMGYVVVLPALAIAIFIQSRLFSLFSRSAKQLQQMSLLNYVESFKLTGTVLLFILLGAILLNPANQSRLLLPSPLPTAKLEKQRINDVVYFSPEESKSGCWGAELPCASNPEDHIKLRNSTAGLAAGFKKIQ